MAANTDPQDSDELEALFDSIALQQSTPAVSPPSPVVDDESDEALEALFDSIAASQQSEVVAPKPVVESKTIAAEPESEEELEALFDSIVADTQVELTPAKVVSVVPDAPQVTSGELSDSERMLNTIGQLTRTLHNTLRELGLHEEIEKVASTIPDTRGRLDYVATLTRQAAERVLNATEAAQPVVEKIEVDAHHLAGQWRLLFDKKLSVDEFKELAQQTHAFLNDVPKQTKVTNAHLMDIMMAQDFQDLTGQVLRKVSDLTNDLEKQLLALLVENMPLNRRKVEAESGLLNGPVINAEGRTDVVTSQDEVDDLLDSLGF